MNLGNLLTLANSRRFAATLMASALVLYAPKILGVEIPEDQAVQYAEFIIGATVFLYSSLVVSMGVREHKSE
jgi:hypothetical protein